MQTLDSSLAQLHSMRTLVNGGLAELLPDAGDPPHRVHAAMRYAALGPGKRLRPLLTLLTAAQLGCSPLVVLPAACALELVHTASLVFDDLPCMDDAAMRRGRPSVHARYGQDVAVLAGIALLNEAFAAIAAAQHLPESTRLCMLKLLARTIGPCGLVGGQDRDLLSGADLALEDASQIHHAKTGVLFIASVEMAAIAAAARDDAVRTLREFAEAFGLAFQALDDLADVAEGSQGKASFNLTTMIGADAVQCEATRRLGEAKAALASGPCELLALGGYVDLLLAQTQA